MRPVGWRAHVAVLLLLAAWATAAAAAQISSSTPSARKGAGDSPAEHLTRPPSVKHFVEADYPPEAEAAGLTATVVLQVDISETGAVTSATVLTPAGHGFDEAAVEALRRFEFEPAEIDGKPAAVRITYEYHFVLRPREPPPGAAPGQPGPINLQGTVRERGSRRPLAAVG